MRFSTEDLKLKNINQTKEQKKTDTLKKKPVEQELINLVTNAKQRTPLDRLTEVEYGGSAQMV